MNLTRVTVSGIVALCMLAFVSVLAWGQTVPQPFQYNTPEDYKQATGNVIAGYNEAPMLKELVEAGKLPPVDQRLPEEPKVLVPVEEIGQYGGAWRRVWKGPSDAWGPRRLGHQHIIQYDAHGQKMIPNIATRWEVSEDGSTYTFYLRKGIKWSDGVPFTADDIVFQFEDVFGNKELTPSFPSWLTVDGEPVQVEKIDDYTVQFRFAKPYGLFLVPFARDSAHLYAPKHYMSQFHIKYADPDELEQRVQEAGFDHWYELFLAKDDGWWVNDPDRPTIWAWKAASDAGGVRFLMERNPYFWHVDVAGNQLPYIDQVIHERVEDVEVMNLKAMSGEIDMQFRHMQASNYPLFMEGREKGNYRVFEWRSAHGGNPVIVFNETTEHPVLRELFNNDQFRKALSLSIDRDVINDLVCHGMCVPMQAALIPETGPYYSEEWATAYAEYDPDRAEEMLDAIGLDKKDADGYRIGPDGRRVEVTIEYYEGIGFEADAIHLIGQFFEDVGIKTAVRSLERSTYSVRRESNQQEIRIEGMASQIPMLARVAWIIPSPSLSHWGIEYARWYNTNGEAGVEPPPEVKRLFELYEEIKKSADPDRWVELVQEMNRLHAENIWFIGTVAKPVRPAIVHNRMRNVPMDILDGALDIPRNGEPAQFFIKR